MLLNWIEKKGKEIALYWHTLFCFYDEKREDFMDVNSITLQIEEMYKKRGSFLSLYSVSLEKELSMFCPPFLSFSFSFSFSYAKSFAYHTYHSILFYSFYINNHSFLLFFVLYILQRERAVTEKLEIRKHSFSYSLEDSQLHWAA